MRPFILTVIQVFMVIAVTSAAYNTMPVQYSPSTVLHVFDATFVNALSGPPYSEATQFYTTTAYPGGATFASAPRLTMAVTRYQASSSLTNTYLILYAERTTITATSFSMTHFISSGVWIICYRMMALDQPFAYHLNLFTNAVPQSAQTFGATTYQQNLVDYSALAASYGYTFTNFGVVNGSNYSKNRIITFISCMGFYGAASSIPLTDISSTIINSTHFYMDFVFGSSVFIDRYHVNMIVYDQGQMEGSGLFKMNYAHVNFSGVTGGEYPVPQEYISTTIMGWTDFAASSQTKFVTFNVMFANLTNQPPNSTITTGIKMLPPTPINGNPAAQSIGISLFYMQNVFCSNSSYFHDTINQICVQCSIMPQCLQCTSATFCTNCSTGYTINITNQCQQIQCDIPYCQLCFNTTACYICNYTLNYYVDGNLGCSYCDNQWNMYINMSSDGKECVDCSVVSCDFVKPTEYFGLQKSGCNELTIFMKNQDMSLQKARNLIKILNQNISITQIIRNSSSFFIISISYINETIQLWVAGKIYKIDYNPLIPALYYSQNQCQVPQKINTLLKGCAGASYVILLVSLISGKIVGLELFGILQLSYMTLAQHSFLNMYLQPLLNFKLFNGLNIAFMPQKSKNLPQILNKMSVSSNFLNNFNIMLAVFYIYLLLTSLLYAIFKFFTNLKFQKLTARLFKQGMITLILFNCFNVAFSAGVHWRYADPIQDDHYWIGFIVSLATLAIFAAIVAAMQVTDKDTFGEFHNKFKNCQSQLFIPFLVVFRVALGLFCAMKNDYQFSTVFILGLSIAFTMYVIINLPFTDFIQNYRTALIQLTTLFILLTVDYYRTMKSNTPMSIKGRIYAPAIIELILIVTCIAASFIVLVRELYQFVKECVRARKQARVMDDLDYQPEFNKSNAQLNATQGDLGGVVVVVTHGE